MKENERIAILYYLLNKNLDDINELCETKNFNSIKIKTKDAKRYLEKISKCFGRLLEVKNE